MRRLTMLVLATASLGGCTPSSVAAPVAPAAASQVQAPTPTPAQEPDAEAKANPGASAELSAEAPPEAESLPPADQVLDSTIDGLTPRESFSDRKQQYTAQSMVGDHCNRFTLMMRDGTGVRSRQGILRVDPAKVRGPSPTAQLAKVNARLRAAGGYVAVRTSSLTEEDEDQARERRQNETRRQWPDHNLWFYVYVKTSSYAVMAALLNDLNAFDIVELAQAEGAISVGVGPAAPRDCRLPWPSAAEVAKLEAGTVGPMQNKAPPGGRPPAGYRPR